MSRLPQDTQSDRGPNTAILWAMRLIALIALGITGYLAWQTRHGGVAGCVGGEVFDCAHVLNTRWSKIFGLPVSLPAFGLYASLVTALVFVNQRVALGARKAAWGFAVLLAVAAGGAAIWFISLQVFELGKYCVFCLVAHSCGLTLAGLALWYSPLTRRLTSVAAAGGLMAALGLIFCQISFVPPTHEIEEYANVDSDLLDVNGIGNSLAHDDIFLDPLTDDGIFASPDDGIFASPDEAELNGVIEDAEVQKAGFESPLDSEASKNAESTNAAVELETNAALESRHDGESWIYVAHYGGPVPSATPVPPAQSTPLASATPTKIAERETETPPPAVAEPRYVVILGGRAKLNASQWPIVGSPEAKNIVVELFDYTCPHCRDMHEQMEVVRRRYPQSISVITLPCPLNRSCNDGVASTAARHVDSCHLARLAVAVWRIDPQLFSKYHAWMFQPVNGRTAAAARAEAVRLVGQERLTSELNKRVVDQYIQKHVALYKRAGAGTVPKLMLPRVTVKGKTHSADALVNVLKSHLDLGD